MPEKLAELIADTIVGLVSDHYTQNLSDRIHDYNDTRKRGKELQRRVLRILKNVKEEAFFEEFDRLISNTSILDTVMSGGTPFSDRECYEIHLNDSIGHNSVKSEYANAVKDLMMKIYDEGSRIFNEPGSNEERREYERIKQTETKIIDEIHKVHNEEKSRQVVKDREQSQRMYKEYLSYVEGAKESAKIFGILPVSDITFKNAFPQLFVKPVLMFGKTEVSYDNLVKEYAKENVVFLADAGCGKSTLLKYVSQFETLNAVYFTAQALKENKRILELIELIYGNTSQNHLFLLIDGLDEAYWNDMPAYRKLISTLTRLKDHVNCWLAGRIDFYKRTYTEATAITSNIAKLKQWEEEYNQFLDNWAYVFNRNKTPEIVKGWAQKETAVKEMLGNPFQLTLLACLADESSEEAVPVTSTYDLYYHFFRQRFKNEQNRGTGALDYEATFDQLSEAARKIYAGEKYKTSNLNDTAVTDLLVWEPGTKLNGQREARAFRHHSLAAFLIAYQIYNAIQEGTDEELTTMLKMVIKDDVTNFVIRKAEHEDDKEILVMREHLYDYYKTLPKDSEDLINVKEKVIYYISRFRGDSSGFLLPIIRSSPGNPYMKLTLAYACALTENAELRHYALEYSRSLSKNGEDASVNRGWTVVYFGDCNKNPYTYRDEEKGPWANAREARIKRFTKENPRLKDYRFWLFDLPLFHTFLKTREWNDISYKEYDIIKNLTFSESIFTPAERRFLWREKNAMLKTYKKKLVESGKEKTERT